MQEVRTTQMTRDPLTIIASKVDLAIYDHSFKSKSPKGFKHTSQPV